MEPEKEVGGVWRVNFFGCFSKRVSEKWKKFSLSCTPPTCFFSSIYYSVPSFPVPSVPKNEFHPFTHFQFHWFQLLHHFQYGFVCHLAAFYIQFFRLKSKEFWLGKSLLNPHHKPFQFALYRIFHKGF